jgi:hypothetical protein
LISGENVMAWYQVSDIPLRAWITCLVGHEVLVLSRGGDACQMAKVFWTDVKSCLHDLHTTSLRSPRRVMIQTMMIVVAMIIAPIGSILRVMSPGSPF